MDRRSWPWKKKSSDKTVTAPDTNDAPLANSGGIKTDEVLIVLFCLSLFQIPIIAKQIMNQQDDLFDFTYMVE